MDAITKYAKEGLTDEIWFADDLVLISERKENFGF